MLKIIVIAVIVLLAVILVIAATRPDTFRVQRTVRIKAPPAKIFALINDFHRWSTWSPYEKLDPEMKRDFSGPASGKGAGYAWESQGKAGAGSMEITESSEPNRIAIDLNFIKPFKNQCVAEFILTDKGDATEVTWALRGRAIYIGKLMGLFFNRDKMVGSDFETGLANLKTATES